MNNYLAIFSIKNTSKLQKIFGDNVIEFALQEINNKFMNFVHFLFSLHEVKEDDLITDNINCWAVPIVLHTSDPLIEEQEQLNTLQERGEALLEDILINEFGAATGTKIDYNFLIKPVEIFEQIDLQQIKKIAAKEENGQKKYGEIITRQELKKSLKPDR